MGVAAVFVEMKELGSLLWSSRSAAKQVKSGLSVQKYSITEFGL